MNASLAPSPIQIPAGNISLRGIIAIPQNAESIVVFAHGLDSNHLNPRNRLVARSLLQRGIAILLPELGDDADDANDPCPPPECGEVARTAGRLTAIIDWLAENIETRNLAIGLFGGRTGAGAALMAAALRPEKVHAVVSRGGRPDLADDFLQEVQAPTLMIVGSQDERHIRINRCAGEKMKGRPMLELIQGASHLFGEPGKLEQVASISYQWFHRNLAMCG